MPSPNRNGVFGGSKLRNVLKTIKRVVPIRSIRPLGDCRGEEKADGLKRFKN
jgi:hypothetical protein